MLRAMMLAAADAFDVEPAAAHAAVTRRRHDAAAADIFASLPARYGRHY